MATASNERAGTGDDELLEILRSGGYWYDESLAGLSIDRNIIASVAYSDAVRYQLLPAAFDGEYLLLVTSLADNLKDVRKFQ